ncbi:unnamed protein product, partial [Hapterophycus canaliculatus]
APSSSLPPTSSGLASSDFRSGTDCFGVALLYAGPPWFPQLQHFSLVLSRRGRHGFRPFALQSFCRAVSPSISSATFCLGGDTLAIGHGTHRRSSPVLVLLYGLGRKHAWFPSDGHFALGMEAGLFASIF